MYCHFVPQTYQKSWHSVNGKKNVYYFDKNNYLEPLNEYGGNLDKNFGIEDLYVLNSSDFDNGIEIVDVKKIENDLSNKIENYWNGLKEQIEGLVRCAKNYEKNKGLCAFRKEEVPPDITDKLLKFIIFQYIRIKKNFVEVDNGTTNLILGILRKWYSQKQEMDEYELEDLTQDQTFYDSIWKSVLIDSFKQNNSFVELVKNGLLESCSISIFYSEIDELILSDNPVLWNTGEVSRYKNLESGVYFPINKNILIGIINYGGQCNPGDYVFIKGNRNFFNYINYLLKNNANNYIGFDKNNISLHISSNFDKKLDWDSMFEK